MTARILTGDCRTIVPSLREGECASIVTDPPYHLTAASRNGSPRQNDPATPFGRTRLGTAGFMGKTWDGGDVAFRPETWAMMLPVVRPGGLLLAFGGTRTYHRLACAIEDGGWEIVDCIAWLYGQGFPKHDSKLKPAFEPIVMARAPGPVHSLAIDLCRIPFADETDELESKEKNRHEDFGSGARENQVYGADNRARAESGNYDAPGRWPANVILDEEAGRQLDERAGERAPGNHPAKRRGIGFTENGGGDNSGTAGDRRATMGGGASRFFYCPKASRAERDAGIGEEIDKKPLNWSSGTKNPGSFQSDGTDKTARNNHPTVKPIALMRWLARLVTPEGGTVLDPFMGSGSTGAACALEGFGFVGTELAAEYVEIARQRIIHWRPNELFGVEVG